MALLFLSKYRKKDHVGRTGPSSQMPSPVSGVLNNVARCTLRLSSSFIGVCLKLMGKRKKKKAVPVFCLTTLPLCALEVGLYRGSAPSANDGKILMCFFFQGERKRDKRVVYADLCARAPALVSFFFFLCVRVCVCVCGCFSLAKIRLVLID